MDEQETTLDLCAGLTLLEHLSLPLPHTLIDLLEQSLVIPRFDPEKEVAMGVTQVANMRRVAAEGILGDDDGQVRMLAAETLQPTACGVAFAVVFALTILVLDGVQEPGG